MIQTINTLNFYKILLFFFSKVPKNGILFVLSVSSLIDEKCKFLKSYGRKRKNKDNFIILINVNEKRLTATIFSIKNFLNLIIF